MLALAPELAPELAAEQVPELVAALVLRQKRPRPPSMAAMAQTAALAVQQVQPPEVQRVA